MDKQYQMDALWAAGAMLGWGFLVLWILITH